MNLNSCIWCIKASTCKYITAGQYHLIQSHARTPISNKRTITSHLNSLNTKKDDELWTWKPEILVLAWDRHIMWTTSIHWPCYCTVHVYVVIHWPCYCTAHVYVVIHITTLNAKKHNSDRLEKLQLEAARIVTGLTCYTSLDSIYRETGWEKLSTINSITWSSTEKRTVGISIICL
jgi:hypothetical protein